MKKIFLIFLLVFISINFLFAAQARNIELVDIPTANTLIRGEVRVDIKFYPGGGILNRVYAGFFDRLMIGGALNIRNLIGTGNVELVLPPKFLGKIRITDDTSAIPSISIGYEGESYFDVSAKGLFLALTKELNLGGIFLQLTGTVYTNEFSQFGKNIDAGAGLALALTKEFIISTEYDSIFGNADGHINIGIGYFFDPIEIDIGIKYGLGENECKLARILKILYISYF
jgi:hypothetical protein